MLYRIIGFIIVAVTMFQTTLCSQQVVVVDSIVIFGNKRTRERIILNELSFSTGDTLFNSIGAFKESKAALMRKNIFTNVEFSLIDRSEGTNQVVQLEIKELWPLYPIPKFDILDRSYTVWIKDQNASLDRVLYGISLEHINLTGNADQLDLDFIWGFKRNIKINYSTPPLTKDQKLLAEYAVEFSEDRDLDIGVNANNELTRIRSEDNYLLRETRNSFNLIYRWTTELSFESGLSIKHLRLSDTVLLENSFYYPDVPWHDTWNFKINWDTRGNSLFPTHGMKLVVSYERSGLLQKEITNQIAKLDYLQVIPFIDRRSGIIINTKLGLLANSGNEKYYYFDRVISKELSSLRAYETNFILGDSYTMTKVKFYQRLMDRNLCWVPRRLHQYFTELPVQIFVTANIDFAYIENNSVNNFALNNEWIYSFGPSLEVIFFNNFIFAFDFSLNKDHRTVININFDTSF